jgi:ubiquinone/menaquinone biosynthesis C-methylase UbiE
MYKDIYYDDIFFNPTGLKHAQKLITSENYYKRIIEKSYHIYKKLEIIETDTLLDIGSGLGDVGKNFSKISKQVYCCDINQNFLNMAEINCQNRNNISFYKIIDFDTPLNFLKDSSITKAYASEVFVHCYIDTIINYLKELKRVLKPNGLFLFEYCIESSRSIFIPIDKNKLEDVINKLNFNIIKSEPFTTHTDKNFNGIKLLLSNEKKYEG